MSQPPYRTPFGSSGTGLSGFQGFNPQSMLSQGGQLGAAAAAVIGHQFGMGIGSGNLSQGALGVHGTGNPNSVLCPYHNKEITSFCRSHSVPLCETCQHEHFFDQQPMIAGGHYPISTGAHDLVRIEKYLADTIAHMQQQLQSFQVFIQTKKSFSGPLQTSFAATGGKQEPLFMQFINDDRVFEEAHNNMVSRLNQFQNFHPRDKIMFAAQTLIEFDKIYQTANNAKHKIQDYIDKSTQQQHHQNDHSKMHGQSKTPRSDQQAGEKQTPPPEITPEHEGAIATGAGNQQPSTGVEALVLQPTQPASSILTQVTQMPPPSRDFEHQDSLEAAPLGLPQTASSNGVNQLMSQVSPTLQKKPSQRRKHWPIVCTVQLPNFDEVITIETNTSLKVKNLKELIKEKATSDSGLKDIPVERINLQIDGGDMLKKNSVLLEDAGVKDKANLIVTIADKSAGGDRISSTQQARERKSAKDEPKVPIIYTLRNQIDIGVKSNVPEVPEEEMQMINTSSEKKNEGKPQRMIEIVPSAKVRQLRMAIKDDLGIKEKVNLKLYLPSNSDLKKAMDQEELKESEMPKSVGLEYLLETNEFILSDDKQSLKETGLLDNRDKLEVEIVIKLAIDVQGKGKDYAASLEVSPDDVIQSTLQSRLSFFKTFHQQRRMNLYIIPSKQEQLAGAEPKLIDDLNKTFREWGIKEDGAQIQLREPSKKGALN